MNRRPLADICAFQWASTNNFILDDLQKMPADRWMACDYADLTERTFDTITRICEFADLGVDERLRQRLGSELPLSKHTHTPPDPDKWRRNEDEILRVLDPAHDSGAKQSWDRCRQVLASA